MQRSIPLVHGVGQRTEKKNTIVLALSKARCQRKAAGRLQACVGVVGMLQSRSGLRLVLGKPLITSVALVLLVGRVFFVC